MIQPVAVTVIGIRSAQSISPVLVNPGVVCESTGSWCIQSWRSCRRTPRERRRGLFHRRLFNWCFLSNLWDIRFLNPNEGMLRESTTSNIVRSLHHELRRAVGQGKLLSPNRPQIVEAARLCEVEVLKIGFPEQLDLILPQTSGLEMIAHKDSYLGPGLKLVESLDLSGLSM